MAKPVEIITHLTELGRSRTLIGHLVARELKTRYRGSVLGFLWTFLNPLLLLSVYALVFSVYMRIEMENYAAFMFTGLLAWLWVDSTLNDGASSIVSGGPLVTKVTFPLQVLPLVKLLTSLVNYFLGLPILIGFLLLRGVMPTWHLVWFPVIIICLGLVLWGLALILATANVFLRDVQHILKNLMTLWFFITPILYPITQVPTAWQPILELNPMALAMGAFQDIFFFGRSPDPIHLALLGGLGLGLSLAGIMIFDRYKESFAEMV